MVDEYNELSRKTARLFSQMSDAVRADFYFKVDDDVGELFCLPFHFVGSRSAASWPASCPPPWHPLAYRCIAPSWLLPWLRPTSMPSTAALKSGCPRPPAHLRRLGSRQRAGAC